MYFLYILKHIIFTNIILIIIPTYNIISLKNVFLIQTVNNTITSLQIFKFQLSNHEDENY